MPYQMGAPPTKIVEGDSHAGVANLREFLTPARSIF
jgi:hypothetical protein